MQFDALFLEYIYKRHRTAREKLTKQVEILVQDLRRHLTTQLVKVPTLNIIALFSEYYYGIWYAIFPGVKFRETRVTRSKYEQKVNLILVVE